LKVFGIGLNKTGTTSLGRALNILGFENHISCDLELTKKWFKNDLSSIFEVADEHNNFEDWPWPLMYRHLYEKYENAKFILTLRNSPETWYESLCDHALRTGPTEYRKLVYGYYMPHDFKKEHINFYKRHNQEVKNYFQREASESLLVLCWEKGDGWDELCEFLDNKKPKKKFPHLNRNPSREQPKTFKNLIKKRLKKILH